MLYIGDGEIGLRQVRRGDGPALVNSINDPVLLAAVDLPYPYTKKMAGRWIRRCNSVLSLYPFCGFLMASRIDGRVVGSVSLQYDRRRAAAELSYWVAPGYRSRGLAGASVVAACQFATARWGVKLFFARVEREAEASRRLLQKLGLREAAIIMNEVKWTGELVDRYLYIGSVDKAVAMERN